MKEASLSSELTPKMKLIENSVSRTLSRVPLWKWKVTDTYVAKQNDNKPGSWAWSLQESIVNAFLKSTQDAEFLKHLPPRSPNLKSL